MRNYDCPYDDTDEDCYKCAIHGYKFDCSGCKEYEEWAKNFYKQKGDNK